MRAVPDDGENAGEVAGADGARQQRMFALIARDMATFGAGAKVRSAKRTYGRRILASSPECCARRGRRWRKSLD
jgi:hypothetical protein